MKRISTRLNRASLIWLFTFSLFFSLGLAENVVTTPLRYFKQTELSLTSASQKAGKPSHLQKVSLEQPLSYLPGESLIHSRAYVYSQQADVNQLTQKDLPVQTFFTPPVFSRSFASTYHSRIVQHSQEVGLRQIICKSHSISFLPKLGLVHKKISPTADHNHSPLQG